MTLTWCAVTSDSGNAPVGRTALLISSFAARSSRDPLAAALVANTAGTRLTYDSPNGNTEGG